MTLVIGPGQQARIERHYCNVNPSLLVDEDYQSAIDLLNKQLAERKKQTFFNINFIHVV